MKMINVFIMISAMLQIHQQKGFTDVGGLLLDDNRFYWTCIQTAREGAAQLHPLLQVLGKGTFMIFDNLMQTQK
jgi:hypothetical protein